jgi:hypothetical protein
MCYLLEIITVSRSTPGQQYVVYLRLPLLTGLFKSSIPKASSRFPAHVRSPQCP